MKKPIILIIAAGVLVIAGLFWVVTSQKSETITIDETKEPVVGESQEETFTGALKDIIARGVPMKCSYEIDGVGYEGLVKGKNYRGRVSGWSSNRNYCRRWLCLSLAGRQNPRYEDGL